MLLCLASCSAAPESPADASPGQFATLQSEDAVGGVRPELSLSCGSGEPFLLLALVRRPALPPGPVFGTFKIDDGAPIRVQLRSMGEDRWAIADDGVEGGLIRDILDGRDTYFLGPEGTTDQPLRWDLQRLGDGRRTLRARCTAGR